MSYSGYRNNQQANIRGLEVGYKIEPEENGFSLSANYSLQIAKYTTSGTVKEDYYIYGGGTDISGESLLNTRYIDECFLNWNQRHKLILNLGWDFDRDFGPQLWGIRPLSNLSISLFNNASSGFPYNVLEYLSGDIVGAVNQVRLPWTFNTDLKVTKIFKFHPTKITLGLEIMNLFNRKNTTGVFPQTGLTDKYGTLLTYDDFSGKMVLDSLPGTTDAFGDTIWYPNPDYSKWRDLNGDGIIDSRELYTTYIAAYNDFVNDPYNSNRYPESAAYALPRRVRLVLGFTF